MAFIFKLGWPYRVTLFLSVLSKNKIEHPRCPLMPPCWLDWNVGRVSLAVFSVVSSHFLQLFSSLRLALNTCAHYRERMSWILKDCWRTHGPFFAFIQPGVLLFSFFFLSLNWLHYAKFSSTLTFPLWGWRYTSIIGNYLEFLPLSCTF